jgi:hypothetical protein
MSTSLNDHRHSDPSTHSHVSSDCCLADYGGASALGTGKGGGQEGCSRGQAHADHVRRGKDALAAAHCAEDGDCLAGWLLPVRFFIPGNVPLQLWDPNEVDFQEKIVLGESNALPTADGAEVGGCLAGWMPTIRFLETLKPRDSETVTSFPIAAKAGLQQLQIGERTWAFPTHACTKAGLIMRDARFLQSYPDKS